jgi:hypothetical protein
MGGDLKVQNPRGVQQGPFVVPNNADTVQFAECVQRLLWLEADRCHVAEANNLVRVLGLDISQHGFQRDVIPMDI